MTVAYRSSSFAANPAATDVNSVTVTKPSGVVQGDAMFAIGVGFTSSGTTMTPPAGWNVATAEVTSGTAIDAQMWTKTAGASEPANYTWNWAAASGAVSVVIVACSGAPADWESNYGSSLTNNSTTDPSSSTTYTMGTDAGGLVFTGVGFHRNGTNSCTAATGWTEIQDFVRQDGAPGTNWRGQAVYRRTAGDITADGVTTPSNSIDFANAPANSVKWTFHVPNVVESSSMAPSFGALSGSLDASVTDLPNGDLGATLGKLAASLDSTVMPAGDLTATFGKLGASINSFTGPPNEPWAQEGLAVEFLLGDEWVDITSYIRYADKIQIKRGQSSEGNQPDISTATFTLDNRDGRFSTRNPNSPYYGQIGRNVPVRISKAYGPVSGYTPGQPDLDTYNTPADYFTTEDNAVFDITGDLEMQIDCEPETWRMEQYLCGRYANAGGGNRLWLLYLDDDGFLNLGWSESGSILDRTVRSTVPVPNVIRQAIKVTLDVNNGASGHDVKFYIADTIDDSYTQLGDTITTAGTTLLNAGDSVFSIGAESEEVDTAATYGYYRGRIHAVKVYNGIGGTLIATPDFRDTQSGDRVFQDAQLRVWTAHGQAICSNRNYRFHGEIAELPTRWESTGSYAWVEITAAGIRRRLENGAAPLKSALKRHYTGPVWTQPATGVLGPYNTVAYWPLEDPKGSRRGANAVAGQRFMKVSGEPEFGAYTAMEGSDPFVTMKTGAVLYGPVQAAASGGFCVEFVIATQDKAAIPAGNGIVLISASGDVKEWYMFMEDVDTFYVIGYDIDGNALTGTDTFNVPVGRGEVRVKIDTISGLVLTKVVGEESEEFAGSMDMTDIDVGRVLGVKLSPEGGLNDVSFSHVAVYDGTLADGAFYASYAVLGFDFLNAYAGEEADDRVLRLLRENDVQSYAIGAKGDQMGFQLSKTLMDQVKEAMDTDMGFLFEPRQILGLGYRTRNSLYNQQPALEIDYSAFELSGDLEPDEDDSQTRNQVTVQREGGLAETVVDTTSPLSVNPPPLGVGLYDYSTTVSLFHDDWALQNAGWRMKLGTVDEVRYKNISLSANNPRFSEDADKLAILLKLDLGNRITVENLPEWMPPEEVSQLIVGYTEVFDQFIHDFTFVCAPESPYQVGVLVTPTTAGVTSSRFGSNATTVNTTLSATGTSMSVAIESGKTIWSTTANDFDIMVGGERMTVTAVSGASSPQTFTVTRAVNGISKTHAVGEKVKLYKPTILAL